MGIYDRDYYRREGPSFLGSITEGGRVCKWLVIINVAAFVVQVLDAQDFFGLHGGFTRAFDLCTGAAYHMSPEAFVQRHREFQGEDPAAIEHFLQIVARPGVLQGQVWRLLTYAFLHSPRDLMHILVNMLFLWFFGRELEERYGGREFLAFYLVSAVVGGLAFLVAQVVGLAGIASSLGASGAVTAVMVLFALHYPHRSILLFFLLPVPVWLFVVYQVAKDSFVFLSGIQNGTAVTVHLGGAAFAFAYFKGQWRLTSLWYRFRSWQQQRSRPRLRVYREDPPQSVSVAARTTGSEADDQLEAQLDAVLEKVARHGQQSLSDRELEILLRASEIYKRRRT
jgi:membrane associated rhomboid family serine protease